MLNRFARATATRVLTPVARLLLRLGIGPDAVTVVGTLGVVAAALWFFPRGHLFVGVLVVTAFVFADMLDGIMARLMERTSDWGAFLDSTLDRFGDAAVFAGVMIWYLNGGDHAPTAYLALTCLVLGQLVSYARAKAESLGWNAAVGIAERADRLVIVLVATALVGLGLPREVLTVMLALLALASAITIVQRLATAHRQAFSGS
ncbi:phosphatidylinositol phosphate synthase [Kribbia dieselivorans]|uniref:phosphatidylinositol phosphate synthase n=1 Tax=Kribbia dieselivorans TaxID=331526 RepID=UPI0008398158|nr:CDP-alcohol phosphatidyltransferase family protein [Kribbia dieselivorans]